MDQRSPSTCVRMDAHAILYTLSKTNKAASIKVYLAGVRSLHIENGFTNPLSNCLRLERVLRCIKRSQGLSKRERLPVTLTVQSRIRRVLNFDGYDDILFWAACCTGFLGFLRSGEFTTPNSTFDARAHLSVDNIQIDKNPKVIFLRIICSKTVPFRKGHTIRLGVSGISIMAVWFSDWVLSLG